MQVNIRIVLLSIIQNQDFFVYLQMNNTRSMYPITYISIHFIQSIKIYMSSTKLCESHINRVWVCVCVLKNVFIHSSFTNFKGVNAWLYNLKWGIEKPSDKTQAVNELNQMTNCSREYEFDSCAKQFCQVLLNSQPC
jgi:hypothetical protein